MRLVPPEELDRRARALRARMAADGLPAVLVLQAADLFWLTGSVQQGLAWVPAEGPVVYGVRRDPGRARAESALAHVVPISGPRDLAAALGAIGLAVPDRVGMELDVVPVALYERWRKGLGGVAIADASMAIRLARAVKSPWEVSRMRAAAVVADGVVRFAREVLREGLTEHEFAAELDRSALRLGHQGIVRMRGFNSEIHFGQVLSGPSGAEPPPGDTPLGGEGPNPAVGKGAGPRRIGRGEPVILDIAMAVDGYIVDQTRTLSIGPLPAPFAAAHADMLAVIAHAQDAMRAGVPWSQPYESCCALAASLGHAERFMGVPGALAPFVGHGVGSELDELPVLARGFKDRCLEAGMTIAVEPKVVFPGLGAVGIEDTFLVTPDGPAERLTLPAQQAFEV